MTGGESNLEFLTEKNPDLIKVYDSRASSVLTDIRLAVVKYLQSLQ
jgi:hypothetical protein